MKESRNAEETVLSLGADSAAVLGQCDANLLKIEKETGAEIFVRGDEVHIRGSKERRESVAGIFENLKTLAAAGVEISANVLNYAIASAE